MHQPVTPKVYFYNVISAQNARLLSRQLREKARHLYAENHLLRAMIKRQLTEPKLLINSNPKYHA